MLAAVQGAFATSIEPTTVPPLSVIVMVSVPSVFVPVVGGVPTSLTPPLLGDGSGEAGTHRHGPASGVGFFFELNPPSAPTVPVTPSTTITATTAPPHVCRPRRTLA